MLQKLKPGPHVGRMMAFAAASGFATVPLMFWLGESLDNDYFRLLGLLLTLPSGAACTYLAFGKEEKGLWSFIKVSALSLLLYYGSMLLAVALLEGPNPQDAGYGLIAMVLIFGFFIWFVVGLLLGWLVRVVVGRMGKSRRN